MQTQEISLAQRLTLMVITDPQAPSGPIAAAEAALQGGATAVQLRWKGAFTRDLLNLATELRELTRQHDALLLVNDRLDVALASSADGAHLGDDDLPLEVARRIVPAPFILGGSVDNASEARIAQAAGADYVGLGPIFPTGSKTGLGDAIGPEGIMEVRPSIEIPLVAIGGIDPLNAPRVFRAGADGVAVIGAIMMAEDPAAMAAELLRARR